MDNSIEPLPSKQVQINHISENQPKQDQNQETQNKEKFSKEKQRQSKNQKNTEKQNEKQRLKNERRLQQKQQQQMQDENKIRKNAETWKIQKDNNQFQSQIREDVGINQQGKPKMPVIFFKWSDKHEKKVLDVINQDTEQIDEEKYEKYEKTAHTQWDKFYRNHKLGFFHHRYYLRKEFPELVSCKEEARQKNTYVLTELGCGVGDTIYPLKLEYPNLQLQACDFSSKAIEWVLKSEEYDPTRVKAAVQDLVNDEFPKEFERSDLVTLIFCLSAISPENYEKVIKKIYDHMKPGAVIYFRDYGKYDFSQLNFSRKKGKKLKDNFYVKHDGTRCYFASEQEISKLFTDAGFEQKECKAHNRYLENRKTGLEMYRVWIQGRFVKPGPPIFDHYGPIEFEEQIMDVKEDGQTFQQKDTQGNLDKETQDKLEAQLKQNDDLLEKGQEEIQQQ